jgi:prepilin-type N-terminal cleavage/methylation domain-containing protein
MRPRRKQDGYTLVELLIVMVIVAILSTISIQAFANLNNESRQAAAQNVAGALGSASVANYILRSGNSTATTMPITNCVDVGNLLTAGSLQSFTIASKPIAHGATESCTVDHAKAGAGTAVSFVAHGIS